MGAEKKALGLETCGEREEGSAFSSQVGAEKRRQSEVGAGWEEGEERLWEGLVGEGKAAGAAASGLLSPRHLAAPICQRHLVSCCPTQASSS